MEKEGVRGAAESSLHALSSAAGAITGQQITNLPFSAESILSQLRLDCVHHGQSRMKFHHRTTQF